MIKAFILIKNDRSFVNNYSEKRLLMKILVTGAFGNVGISTLEELLKRDYEVRVFEKETAKNHRIAKRYKKKAEIVFGDLLNIKDIGEAVIGIDAVIHLAAIIPPLADQRPKFAEYINVGGTENIINAIKRQEKKAKLIYTSSIAIYGDRVESPLIKREDPPHPNPDDEYAKQKLKCEDIIRNSGIEWSIFRLTYIVSPHKLQMDPIMFEMPLETSLEVCNTEDVGYALANSVENERIWGKILHIGGGTECRITYRAYFNRMMEIFGMGRDFLPDEAFSKGKFHCGFMETDESQKYLNYQKHTLEDYFHQVYKRYRIKRQFIKMFRPFIRCYILKKSPYYNRGIIQIGKRLLQPE